MSAPPVTPSTPTSSGPQRRQRRMVLHLASTGRRLLAGLVDFAPVAAASALLWWAGLSGAHALVPADLAFLPEHLADLYRLTPGVLLRPLLIPFACSLLWLGLWFTATGTTPGTRLLGLDIVARDGERLDPLRLVVRMAGHAACMLTLGLGWGLSLILPSRRGLHDLLAGSYVIARSRSGMRAL